MRFTIIVIMRESKNKILLLPSKSQPFGSTSRTLRLSNNARIVVIASLKTRIYTRVMIGVGGICYLIVGIKATNETMIAPIETILLCRSGYS
jgi:hypothetical protein